MDDEKEELSIFESNEDAHKMLLGKLEEIIGLLRVEQTIYDAKLETYPMYDEGTRLLRGYGYCGKIMFTEDGEFENGLEQDLQHGGYTVVFKYFLSREKDVQKTKQLKNPLKLEEEKWVLEKIA